MNNADLKFTLFFFLIFLFQISSAQEEITLENPSFEDFPRPGFTPTGWDNCGDIDFPGETPPDIHSAYQNPFKVSQLPIHGQTYLGMVARENKTWESIAQKLSSPLKKDTCYTFSIYLSRSDIYESAVRGQIDKVNFTEPLQLRIWGGNDYCDKKQLLAKSDYVKNSDWEKFTFYFTPNRNFKYIKLEAFNDKSTRKNTNGNILLDNASSIQLMSCDDKKVALNMIREEVNIDSLIADNEENYPSSFAIVPSNIDSNLTPDEVNTRIENMSLAQEITLTNSSFEDFPYPGHAPRGWLDCGNLNFPLETPPDIHPFDNPSQSFGVTKIPIQGDTYLGMVVRENDSWESVAQRSKSPLQKGKCYSFSIYLSRSDTYTSAIRGTGKKVNFTEPLLLRIWGGNNYCGKTQLLAQSEEVKNTQWEKSTFYFSPYEELSYIILEAFFKTPRLTPPNGNIMLDNASPIQLISCDDKMVELNMIREEVNIDSLIAENKKNHPGVTIPNIVSELPRDQTVDRVNSRLNSQSNNIENDLVTSKLDIIEKIGYDVSFKNNELTSLGKLKLKMIARYMQNIPDYKLIIDFNGIKNKNAVLRKESVISILNETKLTENDYEIRNSKEEDNGVKWLVDKKTFFLGVLRK